MKTYLIILLASLFSLFVSTGRAQTGQIYTTENELSSSLINKTYQDHKGFIWIATEYGLNKFDGIHFTTYKQIEGESSSLKNNYVRTLFEDSQYRFWVGCVNGLMQYNRSTDSFVEIPMYKEGRVVSPHVVELIELANKEIWISTAGHGIFTLSPQGERAFSNEQMNTILPDHYISTIYQDSKQRLWIGTENMGLICYLPGQKRPQRYSYPALTSNQVTAITEDASGAIYVGTLANGVNQLAATTTQFKPIPYSGGHSLNVKQLALVRGNLWVGTDGQGIKIYNRKRERLEDYAIHTAPFDLSDGKIHHILQDKDQNLWLGLFQKGVVFIPRQDNFFQYYGHKSIYHNPIGKGCIMAIHKDSNKSLWISADNEGIYEVDEQGNRLNHFTPQIGTDAITGTILSMFEDSKGNFWIGTYGAGLALLNRKTGQCSYLEPFANQKIYDIKEDRKGNIYIATVGAGLYSYHIESKEITPIGFSTSEQEDGNEQGLFNDWINAILCDQNGLIWLAHYNGISCYNPEKKEFLTMQEGYTPITGSIGYSLLEDKEGNIWAGTSNGLYYIDRRERKIKHYTTQNGLPNNIICSISQDKFHHIWVSTYMGVSQFDTEERKFINYYVGDGLQGNEFTHGAFFTDSNGTIYLGGTNGVTYFTPQEKRSTTPTYHLQITEFNLFNQPINQSTLSDGQPIIESSVLDANEYKLSYRDNTFSIGFSTLQYNNSARTVYQYRILELSKEWLSTESGLNRVTYNNMQPGRYTFQARAIIRGEYSNTKEITILITPPWYETWWAYAIYILLGMLLVLVVINYFRIGYRHKKELLIREHAEQLNETKLQFFINISHEIRTPMTLIINPLEKLLAEVADKELEKSYQMIYRNAKRILRLINQLMDIRKIDKGQMQMRFSETEMVAFINDLMVTFEYMAKKKEINFTFDHKVATLQAWIDANNFDKVLMNILSNAFKYTPNGGHIRVNLTTGENSSHPEPLKEYLEITITDSGIGIDKEQIEQIFERFYQIENGVTQSSFGTGIGLHLSRSLVQLHHGTLVAENVVDEAGSRFIIRIPKGCNHLRSTELIGGDSNKIYTAINTVKKGGIPIIDEDKNQEKRRGKAKKRLHLLIVEDEEEIRNYLEEELKEEYYISTAANGKEGYDKIIANPPHLVISDVMMPEMDGITLCKKIKQNIQINHLPIILLTAKSTPEAKIEGMDMGADAYLSKPFQTDLLRSTIENLITNRQLLKSKFSGAQEQKEKVNNIQLTSANEQLMEKIMKVVNKYIDNPELNVEMLATEIGMSRVHMHRKMKELTHLSARDFIKSIRLQEAARLLAEKKLTIAEVAYAVGYSNPSHFSNSFKEMYGCPPKEYMQQHQQQAIHQSLQ
ncbi:MAG: hybrid sensor histidine kinase/response regulator transcription factor [Phocaeicola sp.]